MTRCTCRWACPECGAWHVVSSLTHLHRIREHGIDCREDA